MNLNELGSEEENEDSEKDEYILVHKGSFNQWAKNIAVCEKCNLQINVRLK